MEKFVSFCACICFFQSAYAQLEASQWYFGEYAGLDFRNDTLSALTVGALSTFEGSASICDQEGNLLFYTDGVTVYNRIHEPMPNGKNLWGSYTTTQTLIAPKPGDASVYYIFTASPQFDYLFGQNADSVGLHYSVVDMKLSGGLGDLVQKNKLLLKNSTEKMTAVHHRNGHYVWLVVHEWGNNIFRSYIIDNNGIDLNPVISAQGEVHTGGGEPQVNNSNAMAQMKLSPDGTKLANVIFANRTIEFFEFDNLSGEVTTLIDRQNGIGNSILRHYGIEFSPNGKFAYFPVSLDFCGFNDPDNPTELWQYSFENKYAVKVGEYVGTLNAMQLAPDGKIYVASCNDIAGESGFAAVIHQPNRKGVDCGFESRAVDLQRGRNRIGLPNFIQSYFLFPDPVVDMPNVFTPNGDPYNPVFMPIVYDHLLEAHMKIINRWGQEVYSTSDVTSGWDGDQTPAGVYYWLLQYEGKNGKTGTMKGYVHLLR